MASNTKIEWCDGTYNHWIGCTKDGPECTHCYAEMSTRARVLRAAGHETWGKGAPRSRTQTFHDPLKWNREAATEHTLLGRAGGLAHWHRPRIFSASLADWLDDEVPIEWLAEFLALIHATPHLDWLLLSKRPQNWSPRLHLALTYLEGGQILPGTAPQTEVGHWLHQWLAGTPPHNVWIGTTAGDQIRAAKRIPPLLDIPARIRFLSCEPLLGPIDLRRIDDDDGNSLDALTGDVGVEGRGRTGPSDKRVHWVIAGGESDPSKATKARPMHPDWPRSLRDQCHATGVPFFFKQWGEWMPSGPPKAKDKPKDFISLNNATFRRIGKAKSGRLLDGVEHSAFPT
jgi:protein gp37